MFSRSLYWMATLAFAAPFKTAFRSAVERVGFPSTRTSMPSFTERLFPGSRAAMPNLVMEGNAVCIDSSSAVPLVVRAMRWASSAATS